MIDLEGYGDVIRQERTRIDLSAEQAANQSGVAYNTWLNFENGQRVRGMSISAIDRLFGLMPGTAMRVVCAGGDLRQEIQRAIEADDSTSEVSYWRDRALMAEEKLRKLAEVLLGIDGGGGVGK